jgi:hypothetical protein
MKGREGAPKKPEQDHFSVVGANKGGWVAAAVATSTGMGDTLGRWPGGADGGPR